MSRVNAAGCKLATETYVDEVIGGAYLPKDGGVATTLTDNPSVLIESVSTALFDIDSLSYRHVELTLDHAAPAIAISGAVVGSGLTIWLIQGAAGTAVIDLSAFDFGDGDVPVAPLVAGEMVSFSTFYASGAWRGFSGGVVF